MKSDEYRIVEVVPHNPDWKNRFQKEAAVLKSIFGDEAIEIEHIGSTAIENIHAKPIVDILIECRDIEKIDSFDQKMIAMNYKPMGEYGIPGRRFFLKIENETRLVNLHIWQVGHEDIKRHLAFRNYMNKHPDVAQEYSKLKEILAKKFPHDIQAYMDGKNNFIKEHEKQALIELQRQKFEDFLKQETIGTPLFLKIEALWSLLQPDDDIHGWFDEDKKIIGVAIYLHLQSKQPIEAWMLPWSSKPDLVAEMLLWIKNKSHARSVQIEIPIPTKQCAVKDYLNSCGWIPHYTSQGMALDITTNMPTLKTRLDATWQDYQDKFFDSYYQTLCSSFMGRLGLTVPSYEMQRKRCAHFDSKLQLLVKGKDVIAFVRIEFHSDGTGEIVSLACKKSEQGRGLGKHIATRGIEMLKSMGAKRIVLEVTLQNDRALNLYENIGFYKTQAIEFWHEISNT